MAPRIPGIPCKLFTPQVSWVLVYFVRNGWEINHKFCILLSRTTADKTLKNTIEQNSQEEKTIATRVIWLRARIEKASLLRAFRGIDSRWRATQLILIQNKTLFAVFKWPVLGVKSLYALLFFKGFQLQLYRPCIRYGRVTWITLSFVPMVARKTSRVVCSYQTRSLEKDLVYLRLHRRIPRCSVLLHSSQSEELPKGWLTC